MGLWVVPVGVAIAVVEGTMVKHGAWKDGQGARARSNGRRAEGPLSC